ncbi:hypothetical protein F2P79_006457 [Pimephales promelas]|nr:hypothetical protein F2P79_006457 [Pimephales promelas]
MNSLVQIRSKSNLSLVLHCICMKLYILLNETFCSGQLKYITSHCALLQQMNGPGEIEYGVGALEGDTTPHNLENANMMSSIRKGVEWLKDNHPLMKIKSLPPRIDSMEEEESPFSTTFTLCHNFG